MKTETTRTTNDTPFSQNLYMAIELSNTEWKLGFTIGFGQAPRLRSLAARDLATLAEEIRLAKVRLSLLESTAVFSCYEAGRDGFSRQDTGTVWVHRYLQACGVTKCMSPARK